MSRRIVGGGNGIRRFRRGFDGLVHRQGNRKDGVGAEESRVGVVENHYRRIVFQTEIFGIHVEVRKIRHRYGAFERIGQLNVGKHVSRFPFPLVINGIGENLARGRQYVRIVSEEHDVAFAVVPTPVGEEIAVRRPNVGVGEEREQFRLGVVRHGIRKEQVIPSIRLNRSDEFEFLDFGIIITAFRFEQSGGIDYGAFGFEITYFGFGVEVYLRGAQGGTPVGQPDQASSDSGGFSVVSHGIARDHGRNVYYLGVAERFEYAARIHHRTVARHQCVVVQHTDASGEMLHDAAVGLYHPREVAVQYFDSFSLASTGGIGGGRGNDGYGERKEKQGETVPSPQSKIHVGSIEEQFLYLLLTRIYSVLFFFSIHFFISSICFLFS